MAKPTGEEAARFMADFVNNFTPEIEEFVKTMASEHRTLQQSFTGLCLAWLKALAELPEGRWDLRNEASVEIAKEIMAKVEKAGWGHRLPMI
jgi:hypothetical protein